MALFVEEQFVIETFGRSAAERAHDRAGQFDQFDQILAGHLVVDLERIPAHRPIRLPLQLAGAAGYRGLENLLRVRIAPTERAGAGINPFDLHLHHDAGPWMNRQKRRIRSGTLVAKARQHDRHDFVVTGQDAEERGVEAARPIVIRRGGEFVVEAELIEKSAQPRVVVRAKAWVRAERVWNRGQRLAKMGGDKLPVRNIVGHLAKAVHVVGKCNEAGFDLILGQDLERVAHHARAGDLAKRSDMRQAGRPVAGLEHHFGLACRLDARQNLARLLEWPGIGLTECAGEGNRVRGCGKGHERTLGQQRGLPDYPGARKQARNDRNYLFTRQFPHR